MEKEYKIPLWANIIYGIWISIFILAWTWQGLGIVIVMLITKTYFIKQAQKIDRSPLIPFFMTAGLSLIGYGLWYLGYRILDS